MQHPTSTAAAARELSVGVAALSNSTLDLVFGVVAFDPITGCSGKCDSAAYQHGVQRWVHSIREHTERAQTEIALFTGQDKGSVVGDAKIARVLAEEGVRVLEGNFYDSDDRVAHSNRNTYIYCVMRNRWFVIRDYLRRHVHRYRYVLMTDVRDVVLQANPFQWTPHADLAIGGSFDLSRSVILSGEGSGKVRTLRQSKKGMSRTLQCARGSTDVQRASLLDTDPLNAGVTVGGAIALLNFSSALATLIAHVTTTDCLAVKDCTDQGLYNVLAYVHWADLLPHTNRLALPNEAAFSYTLGHKQQPPLVDLDGRLHNRYGGVPPVVHQFAKGAAGRALRSSRFHSIFLRRMRPR